MKSKLLLLSFLMLLSVATNFAQSSASQAGIAVQGIARDNNNTARISTPINLTFRFYYGANILIYEIAKKVTTDGFGVFSVVLEPGATNNILMANNQAFLRISEGETIISDEVLRQVPYAIAAANGVPTGSIMPFIGTTAPEGWALCNGAPLPTTATVLIAMVGANAPNLGGRFLKGAGTNVETNVQPITLKNTQIQSVPLKVHTHTNTLGVMYSDLGTNVPSSVNEWRGENWTTSDSKFFGPYYGITSGSAGNSTRGNTRGSHGHTLSGAITVTSTDNSEVRPSSYGVNYIIKL
jgi:microcystin-dependent protein